MKRSLGELRIIGGAWRSRRIGFDADPAAGLRATPDRVRQTLFDWLQPVIDGALCLDLFAGSGALGLEALSRSAAHCTFVDTGPVQVQDIRAALALLKATDRATVLRADAQRWLQSPSLPADGVHGFDVVFVDPPFAQAALLVTALEGLAPLLKTGHRVVLEWGGSEPPVLPPDYRWQRQKQAGAVGFGLVTHEQR